MASGPITSWEIDGETMQTVGSKITADGDCSHEIRRHSLLERKVLSNLDSILKSRDITLPTKVHLVKAMVFPVVMYGCKSWTVKKAEWWRIDTFGKDSDAGRDWGQEEKGMTEDEMVEWHHQLNGHEFEQAPGDGEWQGSLECYSPWCGKELDTTEQLNKEQ